MERFFQKGIRNIRDINYLRNNLKLSLRIFIATKIWMPWLSLKLFRRYRHIRVPFRQLIILDTALKVTKQLKNANIEFVILGGTLLGAIRQGAFAGRPADFDIGVKEADVTKVLSLENELAHLQIRLLNYGHMHPSSPSAQGSIVALPNGLEKVMPLRCQVQIMVHEFRDGSWRWQRWSRDLNMNHPARHLTVQFPQANSMCYSSIFGYKFPIPTNYEEYLVQSYGERWRIPNSKQCGGTF